MEICVERLERVGEAKPGAGPACREQDAETKPERRMSRVVRQKVAAEALPFPRRSTT
jgi:hypothetical protein